MAQQIILKRNDVARDGFPKGESAAYMKLNSHTFKQGEPVCVLYSPNHNKVQGTNDTVAALFAIGTGDGVGMYQAFASFEDMYGVASNLQSHVDLFSSMFEKVPFDASDTSKGYYIKAKLDFIGDKTVAMKELGAGGSGGSGGGSASGGNVSIRFDENVDIQDEYFPVNGVITLPAYSKDLRVDVLIGADEGKSVRQITNEAVANLLNDSKDGFDTLLEIVEYLESHETSAVAMSNAIEALKKISKTFYGDGKSVTEDAIKTYIDNAVKGLQEGDIASVITAINNLKNTGLKAGDGIATSGTIGGADGVTIAVKYDNSSIKINSNKQLYVSVIDGGTF